MWINGKFWQKMRVWWFVQLEGLCGWGGVWSGQTGARGLVRAIAPKKMDA
jgi:hypothetical protein